jgi:hypothetical protein
MARRRLGLALILVLTVLAGSAAAQEPITQAGSGGGPGCLTPVPPPSSCLPPTPAPSTTTPPAPGKPATPETPTPPEAMLNLQLGSELQGTGESANVALAAPNMFGDQFGSRTLRILLPVRAAVPPQTVAQSFDVLAPPGGGPAFFTVSGANTITHPGPLSVGPATFTNPLTFTTLEPLGNLPPTVTVLENGTVTHALQGTAPGRVVSYKNGTGTLVPPDDTSGGYSPVTLTYLFTTPGQPAVNQEILAPSPVAGGAVGRTKIADDNSPLPRDRIIFDYDYFNNVPLSVNGVDVHRFSAGFEKTFFDGQASIEVRLPFASTLNSDVNAFGTTSDHEELGDLHLTLKALLYGSPVLSIAAGLGIDLPTADDLRVVGLGTELLRIKNEAVVLTPYVAYLLTTGDLFFQNWIEFGFDTNGNPVSANLDGLGLRGIGRLNDQTLCQIDAQLGYWLVRSQESSAMLRGLAPFVELHYNATLGNADSIQAGSFVVTPDQAHVDELNLSAGVIAAIGDRLQVAVGAVAPLKGHNDRTFDWQVGLHVNYYFGVSARDTSRGVFSPGF